MSSESFNHFESHVVNWVNQVAEGNNPYAHMKEEKIQEIYALAFLLYRNQRYQDASHFFRLLVASRPAETKYWKGFGACLQMQQEYEQALNCYISAQILNREQPDPYLYVYAADCYFALKRIGEGLKALKAAQLSAEEKNDQQILQHVALMHTLWSK